MQNYIAQAGPGCVAVQVAQRLLLVLRDPVVLQHLVLEGQVVAQCQAMEAQVVVQSPVVVAHVVLHGVVLEALDVLEVHQWVLGVDAHHLIHQIHQTHCCPQYQHAQPRVLIP